MSTADVALETSSLGKRFGRKWALRDCSFALPAGRVAALVGPNGAGKTTLLQLAAGLLRPTTGEVRVFGRSPYTDQLEALPRLGFVAQDHPLYRSFSVADLLTMGRTLNPRWDQQTALARLEKLRIPLDARAGKLSGGQQAQVALALALGKRPDLLLLDEPLASLDPLARRDFLRILLDATIEQGLSVLLSSHIISDLERVCEYLVILSASRVQLTGEIDEILRTHKRLIGPRTDPAAVASLHNVIEASHTERQTTCWCASTASFSAPPGSSRTWHWKISSSPISANHRTSRLKVYSAPSVRPPRRVKRRWRDDLAHLAAAPP